MQVVALLADHATEAVDGAVAQALLHNTDDPAAIALLLEPRGATPPKQLDLSTHPELRTLPRVTPDLNLYAAASLAETI